ncbi:hypothetical protein ACC772_39890, partial [Rhizobium ruizarguesonis]
LMAAWVDVSQRMAFYHAIASVPWGKAYERYNASLAGDEAAQRIDDMVDIIGRKRARPGIEKALVGRRVADIGVKVDWR